MIPKNIIRYDVKGNVKWFGKVQEQELVRMIEMMGDKKKIIEMTGDKKKIIEMMGDKKELDEREPIK